jgi:geranylgeranylglycerol-phosphate geranylgeranyltransferase
MSLPPLLRLIRLHYSLPLMGGFVVIVMFQNDGDLYPVSGLLIRACLSLFLVMAAGYSLNDLCDMATDRINHPTRVLVKGDISPRYCRYLTVLCFLGSIFLAALCNLSFCLGMLLISAALIFYDLFSKRLGIFKDILVAGLVTGLYPLAYALVGPGSSARAKTLLIHPVWFFLTTVGYEMLKDIRDIKGDQATAPAKGLHHSAQPWFQRMRNVPLLAGALLLVLPFAWGYCQWVYLVFAVVAIYCAIRASLAKTRAALYYIYLEVALVTLGSLLDLLICGV